MSTRSQKRRNNQQGSSEDISEIVSSLVLTENANPREQDARIHHDKNPSDEFHTCYDRIAVTKIQ